MTLLTREEVEKKLESSINELMSCNRDSSYSQAKAAVVSVKINSYTKLLAAYIKNEHNVKDAALITK